MRIRSFDSVDGVIQTCIVSLEGLNIVRNHTV